MRVSTFVFLLFGGIDIKAYRSLAPVRFIVRGYFVLILLLLSTISYSQNQKVIDSLQTELKSFEAAKIAFSKKVPKLYDTLKVNLLYKISKEYWGNNSEKGMDYANQSLKLSEQINYQKGIANAYNGIGGINDDNGNYPAAIEYHKKSLEIREAIGDKEGIASSYNNIGITLKKQGDYAEALKYYYKSLKIVEELGNKKDLTPRYNNIGIIYKMQGNYDDALKTYQDCLSIQKEINDKKGMISTYINIGVINKIQNNYGDAIKNCKASLKLSEELGDKKNIATSYNNIGTIYSDQKDFEKALKQFSIAIKIREAIGDKQGIATTYNNIGSAYSQSGDQTKALENELKGISVAKEIGNMDLVKDAYQNLAQIYFKLNDYKNAYEKEVLYKETDDSLNGKEKQRKIIELQKQNEFDRKQADQDKKDALALDEIKRQKILKFGFIVGFGLLLLLSFILYNRNRIKTNANIIITREKEIAELEKTRSDKLLLNILPIEIANELKESGTSKPHRFPSVTVLFTDFKQFGLISEHLTAEQLVGELDECFRAFDKITSKHGMEKIKTIGDSYMCAGGLPLMNFTHPEDAVNAALEIRDYMDIHNKEKIAKGGKPFEVRIGINTGSVVAGIVGDKKFAYDIWGDAVNLASRMESSGVEGKVNISESTYQLVKDKFKCTYRGKVLAKNKGEVDMYFVEKN